MNCKSRINELTILRQLRISVTLKDHFNISLQLIKAINPLVCPWKKNFVDDTSKSS